MGFRRGLEGYSLNLASYGVATGAPTPSSAYSDAGYNWRCLTFLATANLVVSISGLFDVFISAGGGGGGGSTGGTEGGGGGGAGVLYTGTIYIPAGTYTVTVGGGGTNGEPGSAGGASGISTLKIQTLGGAGGAGRWGGAVSGVNSGGASWRSGYPSNSGVASTQLFGFSSGSSDGAGNCGGGAGMGGAGGTRSGGTGVTSTFNGVSTTYCAGGIGGGSTGTTASNASSNTGNGGGGACGQTSGANGGSGIVMIRFKV